MSGPWSKLSEWTDMHGANKAIRPCKPTQGNKRNFECQFYSTAVDEDTLEARIATVYLRSAFIALHYKPLYYINYKLPKIVILTI